MKVMCRVIAVAMCISRIASGQVVYVDDTATGADDGSSWTDAFISLQSALTAAEQPGGENIQQIWVAAGTYRPTQLAETGDARSATFRPRSNLAVLGGFAGDESFVAEREIIRNPTYLDGLIPASTPYNVYHVVTSPNGSGTRLDGFIIQNGRADGTDTSLQEDRGGGFFKHPDLTRTIVANCVFRNNHALTQGGGAFAQYASINGIHVTFVNCFFQDNTAGDERTDGNGGGLSAEVDSSHVINNCVFIGNEATGVGGGLHQTGTSTLLIGDCTFVENSAGRAGGGVHSAASANVRNSILYYNSVGSSFSFGAQITPTSSSIEYCCVQNIPNETNGNINDAPEFANISGANRTAGAPR
jgi:hypothetical protein